MQTNNLENMILWHYRKKQISQSTFWRSSDKFRTVSPLQNKFSFPISFSVNKKSSHQRKRTRSPSYSDDDRISSKQIQRHQGHIKPRNDDQTKRRSHSADKRKHSKDTYDEVDRHSKSKGNSHFENRKQNIYRDKRPRSDSSEDEEDMHHKSRSRTYVDNRKQSEVKGHSDDRGQKRHSSHGRKKDSSESDSCDGREQSSKRINRSPKKMRDSERSRCKGQKRDKDYYSDRHGRRKSPSRSESSDDENGQSETLKRSRSDERSKDRGHSRRESKLDRTPEERGRQYDREQKIKYRKSSDEHRDRRHSSNAEGRSEKNREGTINKALRGLIKGAKIKD